MCSLSKQLGIRASETLCTPNQRVLAFLFLLALDTSVHRQVRTIPFQLVIIKRAQFTLAYLNEI